MGTTLERLLQPGPHLTVGMLTADLGHLATDLGVIERAGVELVHVDVGDGAFSAMFTFGAPIVKAMRTPMLKDVHLLVDDPLAKVEAFVEAWSGPRHLPRGGRAAAAPRPAGPGQGR